MRTYRLVAATLAASLLAVVTPSTAGAVTTVDATAGNATVKYEGCKNTSINVTGDWAADVNNEIQVTVRTPGGRVFDTQTFYDDTTSAVSMTTTVCDRHRAGTYSVDVVAIGYDELDQETSRVEDSTTFQYNFVRKATSRIKYRVRYRANQRVYKYQVPGQLLRNGRGYARATVILAAKVDGTWYAIDEQRTRRRGVFAWKFKPNKFRWGFFFAGNRSTKRDSSTAFRTPSRRSSRMLADAGVTGAVVVDDLDGLVTRG